MLLTEKPFPTDAANRLQGWRSVSVVMGHRAIVFLATPAAPQFLQRVVGNVRHQLALQRPDEPRFKVPVGGELTVTPRPPFGTNRGNAPAKHGDQAKAR